MYNDIFGTHFSNYEAIKEKLFCRLADPSGKTEDWEEMPVRPWMDLAVCCYYDMAEDGLPGATVTIRNSCLSLWHVSADKLLRDAWHNTENRQRVLFCRLDHLLSEMGEDEETPWNSPEEAPLYVLSSESRMFGAVYMAVPGVRRKISKKLGGNYFILPSSIHECLILPESGEFRTEELNSLVKTVNREYVAPGEVLADHVYYYDSVQDRVCAC